MVSLLSVVTSVASSYLVSSSGSGLTNVLVTLASAGLSLCVTVQLHEAGALVSVLAASLISYHHLLTSGPGDRLVHGLLCPVEGGDSDSANARSRLIENIVSHCYSLKYPKYIPTFWCSSKWSNLALYFLKQLFDKSFLRANNFTRELVHLEDGGTTSIDYADDGHLPKDAPVVIFLHTITGSGKEVGHFMRTATSRGWRSCVFNRRGHAGVSLTSPRFNVVGDPEDTRVMVDRVRARHPASSYIAMVGISAGCGLLMSYLGSEIKPHIQAAVALCPAYDIGRAFRLAINYPIMDKHILKSMKRLFLNKNKEILCSKSSETFEKCSKATTVHEFIRVHFPFAGHKSLDDYYEAHNPVDSIPKIKTPLLLVNSEDDIVCLAENIREDLVRSNPSTLLLRTAKGSHISFNEGLFGQGCYLSRVTMDYLDTVRNLQS